MRPETQTRRIVQCLRPVNGAKLTSEARLSIAAILAGKRDDVSRQSHLKSQRSAQRFLAGVPMGTRSGDLDPGLVGYLARTEQMDAQRFDKMVNFESGLLGISETSSDMRDLLHREAHDVRASEAVALFCYQVKKWIGAFAAALGGLDTLVFAGGIGENAPVVRARICDGLEFLGIEIDRTRNAQNILLISADTGRVKVRVIHTDEQLMIARCVASVLPLGTTQDTKI